MVDLPHLELFQGVGRGGHSHDDSPVMVGVTSVNFLQMMHQVRPHGGHCWYSVASSLSRRLFEEVNQSSEHRNHSDPGD